MGSPELPRSVRDSSFFARALAHGERRDPGAGLDAAFVLDTTGSMSVHLNELRRRFVEIAREVSGEVSRARFGVVCFKDHGDEGERDDYLTLAHPLTGDAFAVRSFLGSRAIAPGRGGGGAEAVECALRAANGLAWRPHASKLVVVIGDKPPHGAGMDGLDGCAHGVDYRDEVEALARKGVRIVTAQVDSFLETRRVFEWMSVATGGTAVELRSPKDLAPLLVSVCLAEAGRPVGRFAAKLDAQGLLTDSRRKLLLAVAG